MRKTIPKVVSYFCDRCKVELKDEAAFDARGTARFIYREGPRGIAVGDNLVEFELCPTCSTDLGKFLGNKL